MYLFFCAQNVVTHTHTNEIELRQITKEMFVIYDDLFCEDCSKGRNIQALTVYYDVYSAFMWLSLLEQ